MKKILILLMLSLFFVACNNINEEEKTVTIETPITDTIYTVVEEMPEFDGDIIKYLSENINYPDSARLNGIEGKVFISFVVEKDGSISNVEILKGTNDLLDKEAIRVIENMPNWKNGLQNGKSVRVQYAIPINFKLS